MESIFEKLEASSYSAEKVEVSSRDTRRLTYSPYERVTTYLNGFNDSISVVERNGIRAILPSLGERTSVDFVVRHTYLIPKAIKFDADNILVSDPDITVECRAINKAAERILSSDDPFNRTESFTVDFVITRDLLERRGGSIYLVEADIVVSTHVGNRTPFHPFSKYYQKHRLLKENKETINDKTFGYSIKIVDNNGMYGDRYINLNNNAYRIPARGDHTLNDGVYVTSSGHAIGNYELSPPCVKKYTFEEADKVLGLFRSVDDALAYGDPVKAKDKELEKLKLNIKEKELLHAEEKLRLEKELKTLENDHKEMITRLDYMRKELEHKAAMDKLSRNDYYDERSYQRKEWSEVLKYIPAVITTIGAGYIAWQKVKNPTS